MFTAPGVLHADGRVRTFASLAVMMAFLATEIGHEETLRTLGMTFASGQLPSARTTDTLVSAWTAASHAAQVTLGARAHVAIISGREGRKTFNANVWSSVGRCCSAYKYLRTPGRMSYDTGRFAAATASGTLCSWCETRIRRRDVDKAGTSRSYRTASPDRNRPNIVLRTCPALGTWSANGKTDSSGRRSRCTFRTIRDTIYTVCRSKTDRLLIITRQYRLE